MQALNITCVVFDLGGVVFTEGTSEALQKVRDMVRERGFSEKLPETMFSGDLAVKLRKGQVTSKEFWQEVEPLLNKKGAVGELQTLHYQSYRPIPGMFDLLAKLKEHYTLVVFSVIYEERLKAMEKNYPFRDFFDIEVYSHEAHANKHEKAFYEALVAKLPCAPQECIIVDDQEHTVAHAKEYGFHTILFSSPEKLKKDLIAQGVNISFQDKRKREPRL